MDWKELCRRLFWATSINPAISTADQLLEEIKQFRQEMNKKFDEAEDSIESLVQCLILNQGEEKEEQLLSQTKPFDTKINRVITAFGELEM